MPRKCTICEHPQRKRIERAFIAGYAYRRIAARHDVSATAVRRHVTHTARRLWRAQRMAEVAKAQDVADIAAEALVEARGLLASAKRGSDRKAWAAAVQAIQRHVELLGKLEGRLKDTQVVVVLDSPAWQRIEDRIFEALEPMPKARELVARELMALSASVGKP